MRDRLMLAAWVGAALHVAGLAVAAVALCPGTPSVELAARLEYLAAAPVGWSLGWGVWMLAALSLLAFFALLEARAATVPIRAALLLVAMGAAVDLPCDVAQIVGLPRPARTGGPLFLVVERVAGAGGTVAANGLYSAATLVATLALRARTGALATATGLLTVGGGALMVVAGFAGSARLVEVATGPTIAGATAWMLVVAYRLRA